MLNFIQQLENGDFLDLLVALSQMRYGDNSRLYEYHDKEDKRLVHIWDNESSFKDNGQNYIWVNDYETTVVSCAIDHNEFMLHRFGEEWYLKAKTHFEQLQSPNGLDVLNKAKAKYDEELLADTMDTDETSEM